MYMYVAIYVEIDNSYRVYILMLNHLSSDDDFGCDRYLRFHLRLHKDDYLIFSLANDLFTLAS